MRLATHRIPGLVLTDHEFSVPLDHARPGGERITAKMTQATFNQAPIGGLKVVTDNGWFAARPSGTEDVYKIYAESFVSAEHLGRIQAEAQAIIDAVLNSDTRIAV